MTKVTADILTEQEKFYEQVIDYSIEPTILHLNHEILYINDSGVKFLKGKRESIIGGLILNTLPEEAKPVIKIRIAKVIKENVPADLIEQQIIKFDGTAIDVQLSCHPVIYGGRVVVQTVFRDITKMIGMSRVNERLLKEINEISAPIVPILAGISVLPLVGEIDEQRAKQLLKSIPMKIQSSTLEYLIIDISGIFNVDSVTVTYLRKLLNVIKLLGVQSIVTGIRPEHAQVLAGFYEELQYIHTASTVKNALHSLGVRKDREIVN